MLPRNLFPCTFPRRVEQVIESSHVRRSPRLSHRYTSLLSTGELVRTSFPLTFSATSRSSLSGYSHVRDVDEQSVGSAGSSILDESGQTVPASFDMDVEPTTTLLASTASAESATEAQHQGDVPQHLYGECFNSVPALSGTGGAYGSHGLVKSSEWGFAGEVFCTVALGHGASGVWHTLEV